MRQHPVTRRTRLQLALFRACLRLCRIEAPPGYRLAVYALPGGIHVCTELAE